MNHERRLSGKTQVTLYVHGGSRLGLKSKASCSQCESTERLILRLLATELEGLPISLEVRPWLSYAGEALARGAWRKPALLIDGTLVSQGRVPERALVLQGILDRVDPWLRLRALARRFLPGRLSRRQAA